jgi:UDP-N-acetylmuramoyl-L-alanyl-D-glutamate--2,6-diaminopimelate ligase
LLRLQEIFALVRAAPGYRGLALGPRDLSGTRVTDLSYDSRKVVPGSLYFCRRGSVYDGHDHAREALDAGAVALVAERLLELPVPMVIVENARAAMNAVASPFFGEPSKQLKVVGITGTNGKTTTAFLLHSIFRTLGDPSGLMGTVETRVGDEVEPGVRTTPESVDFQRVLRRMVDAGANACAVEVTSHAIDQRRIEGTRFELAVFTNLSQDHLDYHGSIESYFQTKLEFFRGEWARAGLVNADDHPTHPWGERVVAGAEIPVRTYAVKKDADYRAEVIESDAHGSRFIAVGPRLRSEITMNIPGDFMLSNALAATAAANELGVAEETIREGIAHLQGVPGRLEPVREGQPFTVLVDYAHTPEALGNVLAAARSLVTGRVIAVFGCGGDRDKSKRPLMGEAAAKHADLIYLTSDNPRSEDPVAILHDIEAGITSAPSHPRYVVEPDRAAAIKVALAQAGAGDVVLIAGKGHEGYQEFDGRTIPFDDRLVAAEALSELR